MDLRKIIQEESKNIIKEEFQYNFFDINNHMRDDIESHLIETYSLLKNMGQTFINTYSNKILDFNLITNTNEVINEIRNNIFNIIKNNKQLFESDDILDDLQYKLINLIDIFNRSIDKLDTIINYNVYDIYNEFKDEFDRLN